MNKDDDHGVGTSLLSLRRSQVTLSPPFTTPVIFQAVPKLTSSTSASRLQRRPRNVPRSYNALFHPLDSPHKLVKLLDPLVRCTDATAPVGGGAARRGVGTRRGEEVGGDEGRWALRRSDSHRGIARRVMWYSREQEGRPREGNASGEERSRSWYRLKGRVVCWEDRAAEGTSADGMGVVWRAFGVRAALWATGEGWIGIADYTRMADGCAVRSSPELCV